MTKWEIIKKHFKIEVYRSRHRITGYEMCISNDGDETYAEITEEEYNDFRTQNNE